MFYGYKHENANEISIVMPRFIYNLDLNGGGGGVNSPIPELLATLAVLPGGRSYCYSKFMAFGTRGGQLT